MWVPLAAQQNSSGGATPTPANDEVTTIRTNVPLVLVPVTVMDHKGKLLDGLQTRDFLLTDEGIPQKLRLDTSDTLLAPVSLVIAVQASGISAPVLAKIHRIGSLVKPVVAGNQGEVAVIAYDDDVRTFQDFTADGTQINLALERINGRTIKTAHAIDAVSAGVKMLAKRPETDRRVILVIGESRDRGSKSSLQDVIEQAQRANVVVFAATYSIQEAAWTAKPEDDPSMPSRSEPEDIGRTAEGGRNLPDPTEPSWDIAATIEEFSRLAKKNMAAAFAALTGGGNFHFTTVDGLEKVIKRAGEEIHSEYLLSFVPTQTERAAKAAPVSKVAPEPNQNAAAPGTSRSARARTGLSNAKLLVAKHNGFHEISVIVSGHPEARIRVRPGYWKDR